MISLLSCAFILSTTVLSTPAPVSAPTAVPAISAAALGAPAK